jgi:hypothetical protein
MCPGSSGWQKQLYSNVARLGRGGIDYIYHDQLPCGRPYACNADNHDHLVNDPWAWLAKGHWITYKRIRTELKKELPDYSHTGEDASEPFLHCIDGFMVWRFGMPGHVPLFQAIYAPRIQFVGRGCDGSLVPGTYESFFPKYGEQLVFNEQIGWAAEESLRYPSTRRNYLKKLAHLRQASVDFFIAAEMMAPLKFRVKPETMACRWGVQSTSNVVTDKILHGVWRNIDGRKMIIFLNTVNEEQTVEPLIKFDFENMTACREIGQKVQKYGKKLPEKVTLAPYGVEFWFFDVKDDDPDVKKVSEKLLFTVGVMASDRATLTGLLRHTDGFLASTGMRSDEMFDGIVSIPVESDEVMNVGYVTHGERRLSPLAKEYIEHLYQQILGSSGSFAPSKAVLAYAQARGTALPKRADC